MSYLENIERHFYGSNQREIPQSVPLRFDHRNELETRRRQKNYEEKKLRQQAEEEEYRKKVLAERHQRIQEITEKYQRATYVKKRQQTPSSRLLHLKSIYSQRMMKINTQRQISSASHSIPIQNTSNKSAKYDVYRITSASSCGSERSTRSFHHSPIAQIREEVTNGLRRNKTDWEDKRYRNTPEPTMRTNTHIIRSPVFQPPKDTFDILKENTRKTDASEPQFKNHQLSTYSRSPLSQTMFQRPQLLITSHPQSTTVTQRACPEDCSNQKTETSHLMNEKAKSSNPNDLIKTTSEIPQTVKEEVKNIIMRPKSSRPTKNVSKIPELISEIPEDISIDLVIPSSESSPRNLSKTQPTTTQNKFYKPKTVSGLTKSYTQPKLEENVPDKEFGICDNSFLSPRLHYPKSNTTEQSSKIIKGILKKSPGQFKKSKTVIFDSIEVMKVRSKTTIEENVKSVRFADQHPPRVQSKNILQTTQHLLEPSENVDTMEQQTKEEVKQVQTYREKYKKIPFHVPLIIDKKPFLNPLYENQQLRMPNLVDFDGSLLSGREVSERRPQTAVFNRTSPTSDKRPACTMSGRHGSSHSLNYLVNPPKSSSIPKKSNTRVNSLPTLDSIAFFNAAEKYVNYDNLSMSLMNRLVSTASSPQTNPSVLSIEENRLLESLDKLDEKLKSIK